MQNSTTRKILIVGLIALLSDISLSRRERGAMMAAHSLLEKTHCPVVKYPKEAA
jgi:hypothetical protein